MLIGVPNSQLTTVFSAKHQLTTIFFFFFCQFSLSYYFWLAINFHFPTAIFSVITRIFLPSASQSLLGVGSNKIKV